MRRGPFVMNTQDEIRQAILDCQNGRMGRLHEERVSLEASHSHMRNYNIEKDFSEADDLVSQNPVKLKELQAKFLEEAQKYSVFPLIESVEVFEAKPRGPAVDGAGCPMPPVAYHD